MKKIIPAILVCALAAVSCVKENSQDSSALARPGNYFETTLSSTELTAEEGEVDLTISSNVLWNLDLGDGLYTYNKNGIGSAVLHVSVPANRSFTSRTFALSVSTDAELDDSKNWSVRGKTESYLIKQLGVPMHFSVDTNAAKLVCLDTLVTVVLKENVGYECACEPSTVKCTAEDIAEGVHKLKISFPENTSTTKQTYTVTITPKDVPSTLSPITVTVTHCENVPLELDCSNASNFRYDNGTSVVGLPIRDSGPTTKYDFWLDGKEQYKFYGVGRVWAKKTPYLNTPKDSADVKLPSISGYELRKVDYISVYKSGDLTYKIVDQNGSAFSTVVLNKTGAKKTATIPANNSPELHMVSLNEFSLQFKLYYYPNN